MQTCKLSFVAAALVVAAAAVARADEALEGAAKALVAKVDKLDLRADAKKVEGRVAVSIRFENRTRQALKTSEVEDALRAALGGSKKIACVGDKRASYVVTARTYQLHAGMRSKGLVTLHVLELVDRECQEIVALEIGESKAQGTEEDRGPGVADLKEVASAFAKKLAELKVPDATAAKYADKRVRARLLSIRNETSAHVDASVLVAWISAALLDSGKVVPTPGAEGPGLDEDEGYEGEEKQPEKKAAVTAAAWAVTGKLREVRRVDAGKKTVKYTLSLELVDLADSTSVFGFEHEVAK